MLRNPTPIISYHEEYFLKQTSQNIIYMYIYIHIYIYTYIYIYIYIYICFLDYLIPKKISLVDFNQLLDVFFINRHPFKKDPPVCLPKAPNPKKSPKQFHLERGSFPLHIQSLEDSGSIMPGLLSATFPLILLSQWLTF